MNKHSFLAGALKVVGIGGVVCAFLMGIGDVSNAQTAPSVKYTLFSLSGGTTSFHDPTKSVAIPLPPDVPWVCYVLTPGPTSGAGFNCMPNAAFQIGNTKTSAIIYVTCGAQKKYDVRLLELWAGDPAAHRVTLSASCTYQ